MADGSPLKRTVTLSTTATALPSAGGMVGDAISGLGDAAGQLASHFGQEARIENERKSAEQRQLEEAAERARVQAGLIDARLGAQTELNDLYAGFDKDDDPATAPLRFTEGAAKIRDKWSQGITDPGAVNSFTSGFGEMTEAKRVGLQTESLRRETSTAVAALDASSVVFARQAADADNEAERHAALDAMEAGIKGLVGSGMISAVDGEKRVTIFRNELAQLDARRLIQANPDAALDALKGGAFGDLEPLQRQTLVEHAQAEKEQRERALTAARIEARQVARDTLGQIGDVIEAGYPVAPELLSQARRQVASAGDPALVARFNTMAKTSGLVGRLRGASPQEVQAISLDLDRRAAAGATGELAEAALAVRRFSGTMNETLNKDPLAWASRQGVVVLTPMKLDGTDTPAAWADRVRKAEVVAERYGTAPVYLTESETDVLKTTLASGGVQDKTRTLAGLSKALGTRTPSVMETIAKDQPVAAHVAGMLSPGASSDQVNAARDALTGEALLKGDGAEDLKPGAAARADAAAIAMRQAFGFAPDAAASVVATADAIFAARAARLGLRGPDVANSNAARRLYRESIAAAIGATKGKDGKQYGGVGEYRGVPVIVPSSIATEDFEDNVRALKDADLAAGSMSGEPPVIAGRKFTATDLKRSYLVPMGDGQYAISITDPSKGAPAIVEDEKGRPYKLDIARVPRFDFLNIGRESVR